MSSNNKKLGLIAGNGAFPFLVLDAAQAAGFEVVVIAIKEETFPEIEDRGAASVHWLSLGELSKLIETFQREGVQRRHGRAGKTPADFSPPSSPDWRLAKLLLSLATRNTDILARRRNESSCGGRHHAGEFHLAARSASGQARRSDHACTYRAGAQEHRLWPRRGPAVSGI